MSSTLLALAFLAAAQQPVAGPRTETVEVARVVDGDTLHVRRKGAVEKLRLLSVDTEERFFPGQAPSATKPATVFGEECALWAQELFAGLGKDGQPAEVGLLFPEGREQRDVFGRLLCHVILPDGANYNLLLVELGKSPYFNKYGNDRIDHAAFVEAQKQARNARRGIWDPKTNVPATEGAPSARRPYPELLAWWDARAAAYEAFRERLTREPHRVADAEDPATLARAADAEGEVEVFGEIERIFDEQDGARTVLMRSGAKERALRVRVPAVKWKAHEELDLEGSREEFRQNLLYVRGRVERDGREGFRMLSGDPAQWRRAGAEPARAAPAGTR